MAGRIMKFLRSWMLVIGMIIGVGAYLIYHNIPSIHHAGPTLLSICGIIQPVLLFIMLFLSFCKIEPKELKLRKWHLWLLLIQSMSFVLISLVIMWSLKSDSGLAALISGNRLFLEMAMLCLICPTATACAVVTRKLGGEMSSVVTYTTLINLTVSFLIPAFVPALYPAMGYSYFSLSFQILCKVFPLLILPCICAWLVRAFLPKLHAFFMKYVDFSFYVWAVSLTIAILMSTRSFVHNEDSVSLLIGGGAISLICCLLQFFSGKKIGTTYGQRIEAGQALGQKNTVFIIWISYTFFNPVTTLAGGFYTVWHNIVNTIQLQRIERKNGGQ